MILYYIITITELNYKEVYVKKVIVIVFKMF
jgi:hypothetical protein